MHGGDHLRTRSLRHKGDIDLAPEWATEAALDTERLLMAPDPASKSGDSIRVVGYSPSVNRVLVVILVPKDLEALENGQYWGATAWAADTRTMRTYLGEGGRT